MSAAGKVTSAALRTGDYVITDDGWPTRGKTGTVARVESVTPSQYRSASGRGRSAYAVVTDPVGDGPVRTAWVAPGQTWWLATAARAGRKALADAEITPPR